MLPIKTANCGFLSFKCFLKMLGANTGNKGTSWIGLYELLCVYQSTGMLWFFCA